MPRTAAAFAWLGVIAVALATNISRYPLATQTAENAHPAEAAASSPSPPASPSPGGTGSASDSAERWQSQCRSASPKGESKLAASSERPAFASQPAEHESPPMIPREEPASPPASPVAFSPPMAPIDDADATPAHAVDPLDLGNGVRRLPPVE